MNSKEYPNPYTSCDDPHVDYVRTDWKGKVFEVKSTRYSELPCKDLVDDLVQSSQLDAFKHWDTNFRKKYYTRALFMAYEQGKESNQSLLTKLKYSCKRAIDSFAYWFACKFF